MSIYIDSAREDEVRQVKQWGWVKGVTTNPTLLAQSGLAPEQALERLVQSKIGPIWYQLTATTPEDLLAEAQIVREIVDEVLVLKIAPTPTGYRFVADHHGNYTFCVTAVFSPAQALAAAHAGARYVAVYVNRATRQIGDGIALLRNTAQVLAHAETGILAASLKTPEEAAAAAAAGAEHITAGFETLRQMMQHPVSDESIAGFARDGVGISLTSVS